MRRPHQLAIGLLALALAAGVARTRALAAEAETAFPLDGPRIEAGGASLRYVDRGAGRPIVLIHGAYGGLEDWLATGILDDLAREHRVIAFDRPGHGGSSRPAPGVSSPIAQARVLRAALSRLGVERPLLVGFSWGGAAALAWALDAPDEIRGLALVNPVAYPWPGPTGTAYVLAGLPLVGEVVAQAVAAPFGTLAARDAVERAFAPAPVAATFARSPIALALRPAAFRHEAQDMRLLKAAVAIQSPRYGAIRAPLAILAGRGDRVTYWDFHSERLERAVPGATLRVLDDGGHQLLHSHPAAVVEHVRDLARRAAAR
ncbi:MAG: alpha/beta hydrolase [Planctomycetes bacterium]|nr:alpha/beta hydrolase [Planctomycetota bacterium]